MKRTISNYLIITAIVLFAAFVGCKEDTHNENDDNTNNGKRGYCGTQGKNLKWVLSDDGTLTISGSGAMADYAYGTMPWDRCITQMTKLIIEEGVTTIGDNAFTGGTFTGDLIIPNSVKTIGYYAFAYCSGFSGNLIIGNSVTTIGECAFYSCNKFSGNLTLPNSVIIIRSGAFGNCWGFSGNLTLGNSVDTIGNWAFDSCIGLIGDLTIPNSVIKVGMYAFRSCRFDNVLTIGNSVDSIGLGAFSGCSRLTSIISSATTPPKLGNDVFWVPDTILVYVPSGTIPNYQSAKGWNYFKNYKENIQ